VPTQSTSLPDDEWDARVVVGEHLFENWCDDVVSGDDPEPRTDETWPIVAGTIAFGGSVDTLPPADGAPVVAHLSGLVAERPDGTRVPIEDLDVRNTVWGGAAG
jgi:hypothetical protein